MSTNSTDTFLPESTSTPAAPTSSSVSSPTSPSTDTTSTPTALSSTPSSTPISSTSTSSPTPSSTSTSSTISSTSSTPSSTPSSTTTPSSITPSSSPTSTPTSTTPTSSTTTTSSSSSIVFTTTSVSTGENGSTQFVTVTSTQLTNAPQATDQVTSTNSSGSLITGTPAASGAMAEPAKIAVAVVVPIAAVALLVIAGIFFWRKRKQRKDAEEERRKEVEDYSYNPNNDPIVPDVAAAGGAGAYEMKEDGSSGYRGWGSTTLAGSTGRKASTTMSGGAAGVAYSDATSPTRGNFSDTRSGDGLVNEVSPQSTPEGEILGAMGPSANDNRGNGNVHRGPSNASSSYSAAGRSDGSGDNAGSYGGPAYLDQYGGNNPYADGAYGPQRPGEIGGQPVIRDNPARRNTRIENPSHYPQQSAGISQNF
ncbi:hypothetical protein GGR54DRAFT_634787 [Hypoxylon sp. NC1633]|nr:hypothetical protein GGR54DRAFT_634787 [Hypoxylon sp. NC1633]